MHKYFYDIDLASNCSGAHIVEMTGPTKRVLEIGAGPGAVTKELVRNGCEVVAVEIDTSAIEILKDFAKKIYQLDLNSADWARHLSSEGSFDVVVAGDVLEHLIDPLAVLKQMKSLLDENGAITSIPHVGHGAVVGTILAENFDYRETGLLDKTHIRFFGIKNIGDLYSDAGISIVDARFVVCDPSQTEFADTWKSLSDAARNAIRSNPYSNVFQVVTKGKLSSSVDRSLDLFSIPIPEPDLPPERCVSPMGSPPSDALDVEQ